MNKLTVIVAVLIITLISSCKSTIHMPSYKNQPVATYGDAKSSVKGIEKSIVKAAMSLGWKTQIKSEGEILATLNIRKHQLVVLITHDDKNVSVDYQNSINLKYNGRKIHRQYANWVTNLLRAIDVQNLGS